jgi:hypothetical protein
MLKKIMGFIPQKIKLDSIVDSVTTNAKQKKYAKLIVRVIQIGAVVYLLKNGLIDDEQAVKVIIGE